MAGFGAWRLRQGRRGAPGALGPSEIARALSIHGLWEQETNVVLLTPRDVRRGARDVMGSRVIVRKVDRSKFFGYDHVRYDRLHVPVSDVEKTLIDLVYFGEALEKDVVEEIKERADPEKVGRYLSAYPPPFVRKVRRVLGQGARGS